MLLPSSSRGGLARAAKLFGAVAVLVILLYTAASHLSRSDLIAPWHPLSPSLGHQPVLGGGPPSSLAELPQPPSASELSPAGGLKPLGLPPDYREPPPRDPACFSPHYLRDLRDHAVGYCSPASRANVTCFHSHHRADGRVDSACFVRDAVFDAARGKFILDCTLRQLAVEELERGLIPFYWMREYWYETGPPVVFDRGVAVHRADADGGVSWYPEIGDEEVSDMANTVDPGEEKRSEKSEVVTDDVKALSPRRAKPPRNFLLLKREGEGNLWHCLTEIFSAWMTFDVLRMSRDPNNGNEPFFRASQDVDDTQVVILDDRLDGPYFDLWTLFARRKPVRLHELAASPHGVDMLESANLIVPLAGSSNPLWQFDWKTRDCESRTMLSVFAQRVLRFYKIEDPPARTSADPMVVTFIDRVESRRLLDQGALLAQLEARYGGNITVRAVDFAAISFAEQLRAARSTDLLVGVHGAGLTHAAFMREGAGAVVEVQPRALARHEGYRDVAVMRGLDYFRAHADEVPSAEEEEEEGPSRDWHGHDVQMEPGRFMDLMDTAIRSMFSQGRWNLDIN